MDPMQHFKRPGVPDAAVGLAGVAPRLVVAAIRL
jgi:hypothetical protein